MNGDQVQPLGGARSSVEIHAQLVEIPSTDGETVQSFRLLLGGMMWCEEDRSRRAAAAQLRFVVILAGIPKRETHEKQNLWQRVSAVMPRMGTASGHLVKWSIQVSRFENPWDGGMGSRCLN